MPQPWDLAGAFESGAKGAQQISAGQIDAAAQAAAGNALMTMFNAPMPGAQPMPGQPPPGQPGMGGMPQPGQPPQPGMGGQPGGGQGNIIAQILQRLQSTAAPPQGGQMPPQAPPQMGPPSAAPMPGAQPMPPAMAPQGPPQGGMAPQPGGQPGMQPQGGAPQPGMPPGGGQPQLDWKTVVQSVVKSNPGIKDPRVIAAAVDRFLPIMNQQAQQQWRQIGLQLRAEQVGQGQQRLEQGEERIDVSKQRETRLEGAQQWRQDHQFQELEVKKQNLQRQILQGNQRNLIGQWRSIVEAQHKRAQEIISSAAAGGTPMDPKERKKLIDEEQTFYESQIKDMRKMMEGGGEKGSFGDRFSGEQSSKPAPQGDSHTYVPGQGWQ